MFDNVLSNSKKILNHSQLQGQIISGNIANINNPEYKRKFISDVTFDNVMKEELLKTNSLHLDSSYNSSPVVYTDYSRGRNDNNNVNLDTEIVDLTKSTYSFKISSELVTSQYRMITDSLS